MITHYDPRTNKFSFELKFPLEPIGMTYNPQPKTIGVCVGSGERQSIQIMDIRAINRDGQSNLLHTFKEHQSPSKALRFFGPNKIASGGGNNDRYIKIWDTRTGKLFSQAHTGG
ncbi:hypothetical protein [uncultured Legionella sp.]|uniref:hypothetical protein n=1 Tax=uncultured Legionella sp. TaxID=210934 RepID=UPI00262BAF12|nr:hypothetical protein [uncultured Legionella sp.]